MNTAYPKPSTRRAKNAKRSDIPPVEIGLCVGLLVLGLCLLRFGANGMERLCGVFLIVGGASVPLREVRRQQRARQITAETVRREREQARKREIRRERETAARQERQQAKATTARAETRRREIEAAAREREQAVSGLARRERQARVEALEREAMRIAALPFPALVEIVKTIFIRRGVTVTVSDDPDRSGDLRLSPPDSSGGSGRVAVVRCLLPERRAQIADLRELETWRQAAGASGAYLVAPAGFAPDLIRAAPELPVMLVEAHLLAVWQADNHTLERQP